MELRNINGAIFARATVEDIPNLISVQNESFSGDTELFFEKNGFEQVFEEVCSEKFTKVGYAKYLY